jgi:transposase
MEEFIRIGVDLAKTYFQAHALPSDGGPAVRRKLHRSKLRGFFADLAPCVIGMESCGSAHYWAREFAAMGHEVRLISPAYVKPYVKRGKNDAVDAEAICEAMSRPGMRFVAIKSAERQATLMQHKSRDLLIKQRTMTINALRGHLAEFGLVVAKGAGRIDELLALAGEDVALPAVVKATAALMAGLLDEIEAKIDALEQAIAEACRDDPLGRLLDGVPGVGPLIASAVIAAAPEPQVFDSARDFSAWLGLTPRQNSSGGKTTLGGISKQGDKRLRRLLVLAATSLLRVVRQRKGALADWIRTLLSKKPPRLVTVAIANKLARILQAMMTTGEAFRGETFAKI